MSVLVLGFLLRFGQTALESVLTVLIGVVVAGLFRRMVGPAATRNLFGRGWRGLVRGWVAGMLLPVCSLGVIPVARELRRAGVPGGTVLSFVLAAPLLNPISFLYGLTLAEPSVILTFAAASLALSTAAGWLWDRVFAGPAGTDDASRLADAADAEPLPAEGPRRLVSVVVTAARELAGRDLVFYAIGLAGSSALATLIPFGSLQHSMMHSDPLSPLFMTAVGVPVYSAPLPGMMKIGLMFDHGNSIGAAFVLFALGIGTSLGTLAWLGTDYGWRRVIPWVGSYALLIIALGYAAEPLLYDARKAEAGHTHAFDDYTAPFPSGTSAGMAMYSARDKMAAVFGPLERPQVYTFLAFLVFGILIRRLDRDGRVERWLTERPVQMDVVGGRPWWNRSVPGPVLGGVALVGLVVFSVLGAYVYYPDRERCTDDMQAVYADAFAAVNGGHADEAIRYLERWDLLARKLEVGEYLRSFGVTPEQTRTAGELRESLVVVRDALLAHDIDEAKALMPGLRTAYTSLKAAYPRDGAIPTPVTGSSARASKARPLTRLIWQDHSARVVRWADVTIDEHGRLSLGPIESIQGFPAVDPDRQTLVQMKSAGGNILCGVRDDDEGNHASGWVMFTHGVKYLDHGDHGHWTFRRTPKVLDHRIDAAQGNPAHLYEYGGRLYLANDHKNGYTRFDPSEWTPGNAMKGTPRFVPGGGNHITLAVVDDRVGYGCWIDGGGPNAGRVDVTPIRDGGESRIAYTFQLPTGVIHGATTAGGKVFFAPSDGICWVDADRDAARSAADVKVHHIPVGQSATDKPLRTGAFETLGRHVLCVTGSGADSKLVLLDGAAPSPSPVFAPLNGAAKHKPVPPVVVAAPERPPLALVFHDHEKGVEVADRLDVIALDPDEDGDFSDARVLKTLEVGPSAVSGHYGHHDAAADANGEYAFVTNPGSGKIAVVDLRTLDMVAEFTVGGMPTAVLAVGGRETDD